MERLRQRRERDALPDPLWGVTLRSEGQPRLQLLEGKEETGLRVGPG